MPDLREHKWVEPPPLKRDPTRAILLCAHCDSAYSGPPGSRPAPNGYCGELPTSEPAPSSATSNGGL
jgi:hypothetical protein